MHRVPLRILLESHELIPYMAQPLLQNSRKIHTKDRRGRAELRGIRMTRAVRYEQAIYGSFPFWSRGYAVLSRSAGCRAEWLNALRLAGQRFGERPTGIAEKACLFALCLHRGPWMIVGVFPQ